MSPGRVNRGLSCVMESKCLTMRKFPPSSLDGDRIDVVCSAFEGAFAIVRIGDDEDNSSTLRN